MQSTDNGKAVLLIDGAYLMMGNKWMRDHGGGFAFDTSTNGILLFKRIIEEVCQVKFSSMWFITAEKDRSNPFEGLDFYRSLKEAQFQLDIRDFKNKQIYCQSNICQHYHSPFKLQIQAEVDIAIATKAMKLAYQNQMDTLVLVAGDRDFKDAVELLTQTLNKKVWIFGFKNNMSSDLKEKCTIGCYKYLDDIWFAFTVKKGPSFDKSKQTKFEEKKESQNQAGSYHSNQRNGKKRKPSLAFPQHDENKKGQHSNNTNSKFQTPQKAIIPSMPIQKYETTEILVLEREANLKVQQEKSQFATDLDKLLDKFDNNPKQSFQGVEEERLKSLISQGFSQFESEMALYLTDNNVDKALSYLRSL